MDKVVSLGVCDTARRSIQALDNSQVTHSARIRLVLGTLLLAAGYFYLLIYLIGWTSARHWPGWWYSLFPTRHIAGITWMVIIHTVGVLFAALPVAVASLLIDRNRALWIGSCAGAIATVVALAPSLAPNIWPLLWNSHPVFFVTDQIKLIGAIPFLIWVIGKASSNQFERTRSSSSLNVGGNR